MAENESLDLRSSRRWEYVLRKIIKGEPKNQVSQRILGTLQKAWQTTQKQLVKHGTSLEDLIDATVNGDDLSGFYRQTRHHDYVKLFGIEQQSFDTAESLLQRVVGASLDRVLDQFRDRLVGSELCPNVGAWQAMRGDLVGPIRADVTAFAERPASRPSTAIRPIPIPAFADAAESPGLIHMSLVNHQPPADGARP